jgi:hypothetical protein
MDTVPHVTTNGFTLNLDLYTGVFNQKVVSTSFAKIVELYVKTCRHEVSCGPHFECQWR